VSAVARVARTTAEEVAGALESAATGSVLVAGGAFREVRPLPRRTAHVRHGHKYLDGEVAPEHRFLFRGPDGLPTGGVAGNLRELAAGLVSLPPGVVLHHAGHHDLSRWAGDVLRHHALARRLHEAEDLVASGEEDAGRAALVTALLRESAPPRPGAAGTLAPGRTSGRG
jgi:hypothetical protein